jgi:hypothetical protein
MMQPTPVSRQAPDGVDLGTRCRPGTLWQHSVNARSRRRTLGDATSVLLKRHRSPADWPDTISSLQFSGNVSMRRLLFTIGLMGFLTVSMAGLAQAGVFKIPEEGAKAVTIEVPDTWNPNVSDDTIDTASPDRAVFFWLTVEKEADVAAVKAEALKALTRNGLKIDQAGVKESTSAFAGIDSTEWVYSAVADNGQPQTVKVRAVSIGNNRFIQLAQWGPQAAFDKHAAALGKIFASVKVVGK